MKKISILISITFILFSINASKVYSIGTSAKASVMIEINSNRVIHAKNENERLLTASISKILTAIVAIEHGDLNEYVTIDKESVIQVGSKLYLEIGDEIKLEDLIYGLILRSGNDAAYLIANHVSGSLDEFAILMNEKAKEIGMDNSTFENPSGLDDDVETYNYSTAYDMGLLMSHSYKNETFKKISGTKEYNTTTKNDKDYLWFHKHKLINTNNVNGGKTGYTINAGRTLVSTASKDDLDFVIVTFDDGNDWLDHINLFNYAFDNYKMLTLVFKQTFYIKEFIGYNPSLNNDIRYPISNDEINDLSGYITKIDNNGYIKIYLNNKLIITEKLSGIE